MLNKSVKILSYSALTVTLLMGNITPPTGYFEDDANFSSIPNKLATGWGFSFNKAHADCTVSMDDCITIYGSPPPADPWTGTPEPDPQPEDPTGQEDGGGDNGGSGTSSTPPVVDPVLQCNIDALNQKNVDYRMADILFTGTLFLCNKLILEPAVAVCGAVALWGFDKAKGDADKRYIIALAQCKP